MIIIGASSSGVAGTTLGFSTAVSLISESTVPVMVVNEGAELHPPGEGFRILVADDFSDTGADALAMGFTIARAVRGSTLIHTHVETYADLQLVRRARGKVSQTVNVAPVEVSTLIRQAEDRMRTRAGQAADRLESKIGRAHV